MEINEGGNWVSEIAFHLSEMNQKIDANTITSAELDLFRKLLDQKNEQFEKIKDLPEMTKAQDQELVAVIDRLLINLNFLKNYAQVSKTTQEKVSGLLATLFLPGKSLDHLERNLSWLKERYKKVSKIDPQHPF